MNELSNKMQTPYGEDTGQEAQQQPPAGSTANQQGMPADAYQQGPPPAQGDYPVSYTHLTLPTNREV